MSNEENGKKFDNGKLQWHLLPLKPIETIVKVLMFGAKKYGQNNWQKVENANQRYKDAAMRHLVAYFKGEEKDEESGFTHLAHLACCTIFLMWLDDDKDDKNS